MRNKSLVTNTEVFERFARKAGICEQFSESFIKKLSVEMKFSNKGGMVSELSGLDEKLLYSVCTSLRPFIMQNEDLFIRQINNMIQLDSSYPDHIKLESKEYIKAFKSIDKLRFKRDRIPISLSGVDIENNFKMWWNGEIMHGDEVFVKKLALLRSTPIYEVSKMKFASIIQKYAVLVISYNNQVIKKII